MKTIRTLVALFLLAVFIAGVAHATTTSTVNPTVPVTNSPLSSAAIRNGISQPAYNDITNLYALVASTTSGGGITGLSMDVTTTGTSGIVAATLANTSTARTDIGLGVAASPTFTGLALSGLTTGVVTSNGAGVMSSTTSPTLTGVTLSGLTTGIASVNGAGVVSSIPTIGNSYLTNSTITISPGSGLSGGGTVALGGTTTLTVTGGGGAVSLGSLTTANPAISGDATSGFYSSGAAKVDVGISGVNAAEWGTTGQTLAGSLGFTSTTGTLPTNGIYSPAANQLSLTTSGVRALTVSTTGTVGIGTASPAAVLDIEGSAFATFQLGSSNTIGTNFQINNSTSGAHNYQFFSDGSGNVPGYFLFGDVTNSAPLLALSASTSTLPVASMSSLGVFGWTNSVLTARSSPDTSLSRVQQGQIGAGTGAQGSSSGSFVAASFVSEATKFTASGCSNSSTVGGASAGKFTLGANSCTVTITMGGAISAPNGWACTPKDLTTTGINIDQTSASSTTTAVFSVPSGAGASDVIAFHCMAY